MAKSGLIAAGVIAFALFGSSAQATTFGEMEYTCPIGGEKFTTSMMMSTTIMGRRLDYKPIPLQSIGPLAKCPNGFVLYQETFTPEEIAKLTPIVESAEYQAMAKSDTSHFLATYLMRRMGATQPEIAWRQLTAMWECEDTGCAHRARYLDEAAKAFGEVEPHLKADSEEWASGVYLTAELQRQRGAFEDASAGLKRLREAKLTPFEGLDRMKQFWAQCQKLVDAKRSEPMPFDEGDQ